MTQTAEKYSINPQRLEYIMARFNMSKQDLLAHINSQLPANKMKPEDIFTSEPITLETLKRIDRVFQRGTHFYVSEFDMDDNPRIACCRTDATAKPQYEDYLLVDKMAGDAYYLGAITKLSNYNLKRTLKKHSLKDNPAEIGTAMRERLYPNGESESNNALLRALIDAFGKRGIAVLEFTAPKELEHTANVAGIFLEPHIIVLKQNRRNRGSQIFALAHELGHYLIHQSIKKAGDGTGRNEKAENWCDEFAKAFLALPLADVVATTASTRQKRTPVKLIRGALEADIHREALAQGVIDEYDVLEHFNINDIDEFAHAFQYA